MSSVSVDLSGLKKMQEALKKADAVDLQVGWFESAKYDDATPVAGIAALNELGSKTSPPRPFFRPTIADKKDSWAKLVDSGSLAVINGSATMEQVMNGLGLTVQADVKNAIASGNHKPLSPITLAIRRLKNEGVPIGGRTVGMVAAAIARGETGAGQLGEPYGNTDPLRDTGVMLASLTYEIST